MKKIAKVFVFLICTLATLVAFAEQNQTQAKKFQTKKKIGIIGGAGPMASCQLYKEIITICQEKYGCRDDADFPEIILISYPFSDMITPEDRRKNESNLENELNYCFNHFKAVHVPIVGIACNTLHTIVKNMQVDIPQFIPIMDATLKFAEKQGCKRLLILGSRTTLSLNLYSSQTIECLKPSLEDQEIINKVIDTILAGKILKEDSEALSKIASAMYEKEPFDGIVLGCTELPLLHEQYPLCVKKAAKPPLVLDTIKILAQEMVKRSVE